MITTPFHIYYKARELAGYVNGDNKLLAAFASSDINIYPYQIAAAMFALRSPYINGVILADEGSLGKTYEALLIATQRWYEGKSIQLLVLPTNLIRQWTEKIENGFSLPYVVIDSEETFKSQGKENPFEQDALVITTYDFAVEKAEYIEKINWDLTIFDEASCLAKSYTGENKTANTLKQATEGSFRLLLTPTPITMSIMDIYGLLYFIDETILPDEKDFYNRYFRKPENYGELSGWVSMYCFRTIKTQVSDYVNFSNRIPYTVGYELTPAEKTLYAKLDEYLALSKKVAYPKMERYDLTLMYYHIVSSSAQALCRTLDGVNKRMFDKFTEYADGEKELLREIREQAEKITINGKMLTLLDALKKCFARLGQLGVDKKAIIFTDNRVTQSVLQELLTKDGYSGVLTYSGQNSRDYDIMQRFREDKNCQILVATDDAAKGLDIEFCPVVVNYDMLYNAVEMEQRITRCHRQGQHSDVLVINLLGKDNFADVRIMELINKRVLQFGGIFGLSDDILGNFDADIDKILGEARHKDDIKQQFQQNLTTHKSENKQLVENAEESIFTSFTKEVADKITLTPQYIEDKIAAINNELWDVVQWYFKDFNSTYGDHYTIDNHTKTITTNSDELPELFYYSSGGRNKPYRSLKSYGMSADFKPHHGRISLASVLGRNVLDEVYCESSGSLTLEANIESCTIGFYVVIVASEKESDETIYYSFVGQTNSGKLLSDAECRAIMELPVTDHTENREQVRRNYSTRSYTVGLEKPHPLDGLLPMEEFIQKRLQEKHSVQAEHIGEMKRRTAIAKTALEREVRAVESQIKKAEHELSETSDRFGRIQADKRLKVLQNDLRKKQDGLFMNRMRLDLQLEQDIEAFVAAERLAVRVERHYLIEVKGSLPTHGGHSHDGE